MNSFLHFLLVASAACLVYTINLEDFALFIPMLKSRPIPTCPPNEIYKFCTGMCSDCEQRGMCLVSDCSKSGCDCMPHFARRTPNGPCVHISQCPKPECGENEVFRECGPICERCSTVLCEVINCDYKCYCKKGYLRNSEGVCIPAEECPKRPTCGHNEEWAESGLVNEYCLTQTGETYSDEKQNVSKCYCKKDFRRNSMGHCINISVCPLIKCIGIEVYHKCVPKCNATCHSHGDPNCKEDDNCFRGCFCPAGFAMNYFRSCIPEANCTADAGSKMEVKVVHESAFPDEDDTSDSDTTTRSTTDDNTETSVSTYYPDTDETSEDDQVEETSSVSEASAKESDAEPSVSPPANAKETKGKDYSSAKASSSARSSKHANAAASSKASRQKAPEDSANE